MHPEGRGLKAVLVAPQLLGHRSVGELDAKRDDLWQAMQPPEAVYVRDDCESDGELRVLEPNPFSGADLSSGGVA